MNKKQVLQTMFVLCTTALFTTGCGNDELTPGIDDGSDETSVVFSLGLPAGDEVNYTRAEATPIQDATEWTLKTVRVYHFSTTTTMSPTDANYALVKAYDIPVEKTADADAKPGSGKCVDYGDGEYSIRISLRSNAVGENNRHKFIVVANDACAAFDEKLEAEDAAMPSLAELKECIADKKMKNDSNAADLFMGNTGGLCMTGETEDLTLTRGHNTPNDKINLTRIMARLDVKSFVSASKVFKLQSVALKYNGNGIASQGYLFEQSTPGNIWYDKSRETMEIIQNSKYNTIGFPDYDSYKTEQDWIGQTTQTVEGVLRHGTWYKKVLYIYPYPTSFEGRPLPTPTLLINYTLNGAPGSKEVAMKDPTTTAPFDIKRNYVYTLQVGDPNAASDELSFAFTCTAWTAHELDADLNEGEAVK